MLYIFLFCKYSLQKCAHKYFWCKSIRISWLFKKFVFNSSLNSKTNGPPHAICHTIAFNGVGEDEWGDVELQWKCQGTGMHRAAYFLHLHTSTETLPSSSHPWKSVNCNAIIQAMQHDTHVT